LPGRDHELDFWTSWLEQRGGRWSEDYARRLAPAPLIDDELVTARLDEIDRVDVKIIDVGAGPVSKLGTHYPGKNIEVVAVDPLADEYDRLLARFGVEPPVRTIRAHGERLLVRFAPASFDIAYAVNSIDHSYDPVRVVQNMLALVRPDGVVLLRHRLNEGEHERYVGLHQWNFDVQDTDLVIWNHAATSSLRRALNGRGDVEAWIKDDMALARVTPRSEVGQRRAET
jgi:SAM-dependent methyltransferase